MKPFQQKISSTFIVLSTLLSFSLWGQTANLAIGTYTARGSKGIYLFHFDTATGKATQISHTHQTDNPSFLTISKDKQFLYAVNETTNGKVSSYLIKNNRLELLQQRSTRGADPCHIVLSPDQQNLFVANYSGGSITQFHRSIDGSISNARQWIEHKGKSINTPRQEKAHVHGVFFSPNGRYLLTPDLGKDEVSVYPYNGKNTPTLDVSKANHIKVLPGAGPRHLTFSQNGKFFYVIEELTGTIRVFTFNQGNATYVQQVSLHTSDFTGKPGSADIHLSPDGKFLYASNRGSENNIIKIPVFKNGLLDEKNSAYFSTKGEGPRNFTISEDGKWLLVANQNTDNIVIFKRDLLNGNLLDSGYRITLSMPVCVVLF